MGIQRQLEEAQQKKAQMQHALDDEDAQRHILVEKIEQQARED